MDVGIGGDYLEEDCWNESCGSEGGCESGFPPECDPGQSVDFSRCCCVAYEGGPCLSSPVLIDVGGNGFALTAAANGVSFDVNADGTAERTSWTAPAADDYWLVLDRNGNAAIDDGSELFGNHTPQPESTGVPKNGFLALAQLDKPLYGGNGDGLITAADSVFNSLRLWRDANHNGVSEADELASLTSRNVQTLELNYKTSRRTDEYGNEFRYRAKVKNANGSQVGRWAWDVFLVSVR